MKLGTIGRIAICEMISLQKFSIHQISNQSLLHACREVIRELYLAFVVAQSFSSLDKIDSSTFLLETIFSVFPSGQFETVSEAEF